MFDPEMPRGILDWRDTDMATELPGAEDDRHEFKSSATPDGDLKRKVIQAASACWNSGGGIFVAGVDGSGLPDGGISRQIGRQARRDWLDQAISEVQPRGVYAIAEIIDDGGGLNIGPAAAVYVIGFGTSEALPHMSSDKRYYIRAGAHTVAASHFLLEALRARRGLTRPLLRSTFRIKPQRSSVLQLGIIALNEAPAIDVEISFDPLPPMYQRVDDARLPIRASVVDQRNPLFFDYAFMYSEAYGVGDQQISLFLRYRDIAAREYEQTVLLDPLREMGPRQAGTPPDEKIEQHLDKIEKGVAKAAAALADLSKLEKHAGQTAGAMRDLSRKIK
jgi:hypothetical protein